MRPAPAQSPASTASVAEIIAEALTRRIVLGEWPPGRRLGQDQIAREFHASHVPVREAFRRLEGRGLLVGEPRRGVRVAPIDPASVREVSEMRAALEGLALRHAMPLSPAALAEARAAIATGAESSDRIVWESANRRFHRALMAGCPMPRLLDSIDDLHQASARFLLATWKDLDWQARSQAEHGAILDRAAAGDGAAAGAMLGRHILDAGYALAAMIEARG